MKKILLSAMMTALSVVSFAQTKVLYFADGTSGTDYVPGGLTSTGCIVTTVTDHASFQTAIATPSNFDLVIHFMQANYPDPASVSALINYMSIPGKKGWYCDWSKNPTFGSQVGVSFTGPINSSPVTITDPTIAAGLTTNPFSVFNAGWGTYATDLTPLSGGVVLGTFPSGNASLVSTMGGNMLVFGYTGDSPTSSEIYASAINYMFPPVPTSLSTDPLSLTTYCVNMSLGVNYTAAGSFSTGNVFTAQLSNASGSFASPINIGSTTATTSGSIGAVIPAVPTGTGYRIRVVSSSPSFTGTDNGTNLTINALPVATVNHTPITCNGENSTVIVSASGGTGPYMGTGTFSVPAGPYSYTVTDAVGCVSAASTGTITEPAPVNIATTTSGITITASATPATYQWLDCDNGYAAISGATSQSYTATANGNYAVEVTEGGCKDTTACVPITTLSLSTDMDHNGFSIYPNPSNGSFNLKSSVTGNLLLLITDAQGKQVMKRNENVQAGQVSNINIEGISKGLYFVQVHMGNVFATEKLVIE